MNYLKIEMENYNVISNKSQSYDLTTPGITFDM